MGRIQSIVSFSTFDGPGTRCVVFLQGCPVGCVFCHNPDSWDFTAGEENEADALLRRLEEYRSFLNSPGLAISGGEPLCQPQFVLEIARRAHGKGWHVALDTSAWGPVEKFMEVCRSVDLVMVSIKHPLNPAKVANVNEEGVVRNLQALAGLNVPVWLRYVLVPG